MESHLHTLRRLRERFAQQRLNKLVLFAYVVALVGLVFGFMAAHPVLSSFIYPLF